MISLHTITRENLSRYAKGISALESTYPEELRADESSVLEMLSDDEAIAIVALSGDTVAGAVYGFSLSEEEIEEYNLSEVASDGDIYLESITVDESVRGKGVGYQLIAAFADEAYKAGFSRIVGHFRQNGSFALAKKIGGKVLHREADWYGSGEDFICCACDLPVRDA